MHCISNASPSAAVVFPECWVQFRNWLEQTAGADHLIMTADHNSDGFMWSEMMSRFLWDRGCLFCLCDTYWLLILSYPSALAAYFLHPAVDAGLASTNHQNVFPSSPLSHLTSHCLVCMQLAYRDSGSMYDFPSVSQLEKFNSFGVHVESIAELYRSSRPQRELPTFNAEDDGHLRREEEEVIKYSL